MAEPGTDPRKATASSLIAELWSEREQSLQALAPPPHVVPTGRRGSGPPRQGGGKSGLAIAVIAVALLLGGGAGVFMATQGVGMTSKAKFVAKADAVCRPSNGTVLSVTKPTSYPELATAATALVTATDAQLAGLRKLSLPGGADGGRARDVLSALTLTNAAGRSLQDAAGRKDDAATAAATTQLRSAATDASSNATQLGFTACVTGMTSGVDAVTGGATAVVKTAFVAKADSLCRAVDRDLAALPAPKTGNAAIGRYMTQTLGIVQKFVNDVKAVTVPPGDEVAVAEIMAALDKYVAKFGEAPGAATSGDRSRFEAIEREMAPLETALNSKFDTYGVGTCGSNFGG